MENNILCLTIFCIKWNLTLEVKRLVQQQDL